MSISKWVIGATLAGVVVGGSACTSSGSDDALDQTQSVDAIEATKDGAAVVVDETKNAGEATADSTNGIVETTGDKAKEIAGMTADKTKEIAVGVGTATQDAISTTGEVITDGWITTKVKAKFVDETVLEGSDINVDTNSHVVTLKGRVPSSAAKSRAAAIALGTEGVTSVVNDLVVRAS
jgi:hyperosmotically inducible periplasmic protein